MKLSEAILLGSTLRPQCRFEAFSRRGGSCAFGAALEAMGTTRDTAITEFWPWLNGKTLVCPACAVTEVVGAAIISSHLNDSHGWSRERIAEWVATVEPTESEPQVTEESPSEVPQEVL